MGSDSMSWHRLILKMVSIHAPTWGATYRPFKTQEECWFQSTLPHGERRGTTDTMGRGHQVSIHAPTWGATYCLRYTGLVSSFQSTLPHGERRVTCNQLENSSTVSIHAPTWGATRGMFRLRQRNLVSIHAPTWGATYINIDHIVSIEFQSTLPHGERPP